MSTRSDFTTIRTEGALLPPGLLKRLREPNNGLPATDAAAYHVTPPRRLSEAISEAWNSLQGSWTAYRDARDRLPESDTGTTLTRERWLQPLFQALGYGRLLTRTATTIDGITYPISHGWHHVPIHLISFRIDLDRRTAGVAGAARTSPHSLVQGYLNATSDSLWGVVTNGHRLRLLRDHHALTRQSYVEYDLEAMFDGEVYADFVLLYLTLHQSRLEADNPVETILEQWATEARDSGTRALDRLRDGVHKALQSLGQGFLDHPANAVLRQRLRDGDLDAQDYYRQLLRLVYRCLILFAAEDRDLLHPPDSSDAARNRYEHYSTRNLRSVADVVRGGKHPDRYEAFKRLTGWLSSDGVPALGLPALGGFLFGPTATPDLDDAALSNRAFLRAVRALAFTDTEGARLPVDYRNLGAEELGSVYEGLLELHPSFEHDRFDLATAAGNERRTTGSFYTPTGLITLLLDSALQPVLDEAAAAEEPERAILDLKIVDPASGSGHFLIAAAHRIARRLAQVRTGDDEPAIDATRAALRDVIGRCLYAVDLNPMATELCRVALWLEALEPGKPLSFLDHHIKTGNSLIGVGPRTSIAALLRDGIPDDAYAALGGDDSKFARAARDRNRRERSGERGLFATTDFDAARHLADNLQRIDAAGDDDIADLRAKERAYDALTSGDTYMRARTIADTWTAAYFWPKHPHAPRAITTNDLHDLNDGRPLEPERVAQLGSILDRHAFLHWRVEFPDAFERDSAGFDVVLGNPPWERLRILEREWFAARDPDIASAPNAHARAKLIKQLKEARPSLYEQFNADLRAAEAESHFIRTGSRYPLCGRGDVNTYAVFAELNQQLTSAAGRTGFIVPSGIATDNTTKHFFASITGERQLVRFFDFENRKGIFPGVHRSYKFALVTLTGAGRPTGEAVFVFFAHDIADVHDEDRRFALTADDIALLNPNTRTCPTFRTRRDAEITKGIYRRLPVLINEETGENPWGVRFTTMFHMALDSGHFRTREQLEGDGYHRVGNRYEKSGSLFLPLYEAKMIHQFDHRYATYTATDSIRDATVEEHEDAEFEPQPRYWVESTEANGRLERRRADGRIEWSWDKPWLLGFRDIARSTDERTAIFALIPRTAVGNSLPLCLLSGTELPQAMVFAAAVSSFAFDFVARQAVGGTHMNFFIVKQLPVPPPDAYTEADLAYVQPRVTELVATSASMATAMSIGATHRWDVERRWKLRADLDAFFFRMYGLTAEEAAYVMDTFPITRRRDEQEHGSYRTKNAILAAYADLAQQPIGLGLHR